GLPPEEGRQAIATPLAEIMTAIHATLEETPPELAADITTEGVLLAGGGSLLRGFDERVARETGMPVRVADDPLACVATGAGMSLEELDTLPRPRPPPTPSSPPPTLPPAPPPPPPVLGERRPFARGPCLAKGVGVLYPQGGFEPRPVRGGLTCPAATQCARSSAG